MKEKVVWHYYCTYQGSSNYLEEYEFFVPWRKETETRTRLSPRGWDLIHSSIHEAKHVHEVEISVKELEEVFLKGMHNPWKRWRGFRHWQPSWIRHRKSNHYVRQVHHQVKIVDEHRLAKENWRKEKGLNLDKQKNGWKRRGAGKYYKRLSNSMHRSWEKETLYREDYDSMSDVDHKFFLDPWMWD